MTYLPESGYRRLLVISFYLIAGGALFYITFKYLLGLVLPFVIAWLVALILRPVITYLHKKTRLPEKLLSLVLVVGLLALVGFGLFAALNRIYNEIVGLLGELSDSADSIMDSIFDFIDSFTARIPLIDGIGMNSDSIYSTVSEMLKSTLSALSSRLPDIIAALIRILPGFLFFTIILIMASYYITADFPSINRSIAAQLPMGFRKKTALLREKLVETGFKYLRAYLLMLLFTFAQLLVGFVILDFDYAFTIALVVAAVDVLPVLGVGTVLVPWSGILLLRGMYYEGFGLLIIFAAVSVVRQIIEPRIIGMSCGLSPLVTLISMYAGFKAFGVVGMLVMPMLAILLKNLNDSGVITLWRKSETKTDAI